MLTRARTAKKAAEDNEKQHTATILYRLPPPLLTLVLHFLSLPDKLTQLTRLHHSFPPLTPTVFSSDSLTLTHHCWLRGARLLVSTICCRACVLCCASSGLV